MGKDEVKAVNEILGNKKKYTRAILVISLICITLMVIAYCAFSTGSITWHIE